MSETTEALQEAQRLVDSLVDAEPRHEVLDELRKLGKAALPAVLEGLRHGNWQVRRWCAIYLDHDGEPGALHLLIPLLRDPKKEVRIFAVHSISCDRCKTGDNPVDVFPLLVERIEVDESIRVRRMATAMLAYGAPDPRAVPVFHALMERETDKKLRLHASLGLMRCREAGLDAP